MARNFLQRPQLGLKHCNKPITIALISALFLVVMGAFIGSRIGDAIDGEKGSLKGEEYGAAATAALELIAAIVWCIKKKKSSTTIPSPASSTATTSLLPINTVSTK